MAKLSLLHVTLCLLLITTLSTLVVSARPGPCNTFIISTYSFTLHPLNPSNPSNPNSNNNPDLLFLDLRPIHRPHYFFRRPHHFIRRPRFNNPNLNNINNPFLFPSSTQSQSVPKIENKEVQSEMTDLPLGFNSFRERTKDILSVVASLLFGAACGALSAGTMYLIWALFNYRRGDYRSVGDGFSSDESDDDDDFDPKACHYAPMPPSPVKEKKNTNNNDAAAADVVVSVVPVAKEVV